MSHDPHHASEDDGYLYVARIATTPVTAYLHRIFAYTRPEDVPLGREWEAWASGFRDLEEVWDACLDPEFLLVLHYYSSAASADWNEAVRALQAFQVSCLGSAGLDEDAARPFGPVPEDGDLDFLGWFCSASPGPAAAARRALKAAIRARTEAGEERSGVQHELAGAFKDLVPNPFVNSVETSDRQSFWRELPEEDR